MNLVSIFEIIFQSIISGNAKNELYFVFTVFMALSRPIVQKANTASQALSI